MACALKDTKVGTSQPRGARCSKGVVPTQKNALPLVTSPLETGQRAGFERQILSKGPDSVGGDDLLGNPGFKNFRVFWVKTSILNCV